MTLLQLLLIKKDPLRNSEFFPLSIVMSYLMNLIFDKYGNNIIKRLTKIPLWPNCNLMFII